MALGPSATASRGPLATDVIVTYIWVMSVKVNVFEIKAKFAEYLDRVARGERVVIHRYNTPVAELSPVTAARAEPRPIGPVAGRPTFDLPPSFFEPLEEGDLKAWEGASDDAPLTDAFTAYAPEAPRVAEAAPPATKPARRKARRS